MRRIAGLLLGSAVVLVGCSNRPIPTDGSVGDSGISDAGASDVLEDASRDASSSMFCVGNQPKAEWNGVPINITDTQGHQFMGACCEEGATVRIVGLHNGQDVELAVTTFVFSPETITTSGPPVTVSLSGAQPGLSVTVDVLEPSPSQTCVPPPSGCTQLAQYRTGQDNLGGTMTLDGTNYLGPMQLNLCLVVRDPAAPQGEAIAIYVPNVTIPKWRFFP